MANDTKGDKIKKVVEIKQVFMNKKEEPYYDEKGNKYWSMCIICKKYKYYVGWTKWDESKICYCRNIERQSEEFRNHIDNIPDFFTE
jgi:beta-lactamase class D